MITARLFPLNLRSQAIRFAAFIIIIGVLCLILLAVFRSWCVRLSCIDMQGMRSWKLAGVYEEKNTVFRALYSVNGTDKKVRVEIRKDVDPAAGWEYATTRVTGMDALYDNIRSPYPGLLSQEIVCDQGFKPTHETIKSTYGVSIQKITGYLTDRYVFGPCTKEQSALKEHMLLFACPKQRNFYIIELIAPLKSFPDEEFSREVQSLRCR